MASFVNSYKYLNNNINSAQTFDTDAFKWSFSQSILLSTDYYLKDPNTSQYLNYVTSYACLQKLKRIPHCKTKRAEPKNQDGDGALCAKRTMRQRAKFNIRITMHP